MASQSSTSSEIFWASSSLSISNVVSKFTNKETLLSFPFSCKRDPRPSVMQIEAQFGVQRRNILSVSFWIIGGRPDIKCKSAKLSLFDDKRNRLKSTDWFVIGHQPDKRPFKITIEQFFKVTRPANVTWRITAEVEYERSPLKNLVADNVQWGGDLLKLFESAEDSDVVFSVGDEKIKAHKMILKARSSYFSNMFESGMRESVNGEVEVTDVDPDVFRGMLEYVYGDCNPKNLDNIATRLFTAADKYDFEELKEICAKNIAANLKADNVVDALLLAERHHLHELMPHAKAVLRANINAVKDSVAGRAKLIENPKLLFDLFVDSIAGFDGVQWS